MPLTWPARARTPWQTPRARPAGERVPTLGDAVRRPLRQALAALLTVAAGTASVFGVVLLVLGPEAQRYEQARVALQRGHAAMVDQETGLRGFLVTRDPVFLEPFHAGAVDLVTANGELRRLAADDAELSRALAEVQAGQLAWRDRWAHPLLTHQPDVADGDALADLLHDGKRLFDDYRTSERAVNALISERLATAADVETGVGALGVAVALVFCGTQLVLVARAGRRLDSLVVPPVQQVRATLRHLAGGALHARADAAGPVEVREIVTDVNELADALQRERDLTAAREAELIGAREEAVAAGVAKASFLATMSHEIRTPLNAVIGLTDLLLDTHLTAEQRQHLATVSRSGDSLLALVNDILDYSKIEAGGLDLEQAPFELHELVHGAVEIVAPQVDPARVDLVVDVAAGAGAAVGDASRLRQVLLNLLSNAVKFTPRGRVAVTADLQPTGDGGRLLLTVAVRDTGIGIAPDRVERLFEPFTQADASTTRMYGGSGLGLAISRRIALAMGGNVTVQSTPGAGSVFTLTALVAPDPTGGRGAEDGALPLDGVRILVVDDNATNLQILRAQVRRLGASCLTAVGAADALSLVEEGLSVDVAVLDLHMAGTDGLALATAFRERLGGALPLILLSSVTPPGAAAELFAARLRKPAAPGQLVAAVRLALGRVRAVEAAAPAVAPVSLRVLVAEDHQVNQQLTVLLLQRLGHVADVVDDGAAAVSAVRGGHYDVVLMDGQMPVMDGLTATRAIRALPGSHPRIVALTAGAFVEDRDAFLRAGADVFCTKPLRLEVLSAALAPAVAARTEPRAGLPAPPGVTPAPAPARGEPAVEPGRAGVLDEEVLADLRALGGADLQRLVGRFAGRLPGSAAQLREAHERGEPLDRLAHTLKGSSGSFGALRVAEVCRRLEDSSQPEHVRAGLLDRLEEEVEAAVRALEAMLAEVAGQEGSADQERVTAPLGW